MRDLTNYVYNKIFPEVHDLFPKPHGSYLHNDIVAFNVVIIGGQGVGKSERARTIVETAVKKYGLSNVNVVYSDESFGSLFKRIDNKLVQILVRDDITLEHQAEDDLNKFFKVRHLMERKGRVSGLVITILITHRLYGIKDPNLRSTVNLFLIASPPQGWDRSVTKQLIGEEGLVKLKQLSDLGDKGTCVCSIGSDVGLFKSGLATTNYLQPKSSWISTSTKRRIKTIFKWIAWIVIVLVVYNALFGRKKSPFSSRGRPF